MAKSSPAATEALVRKFMDIVNDHKFLYALSLASPSATWWNSGDKEQNPLAGSRSFHERVCMMLAVPDIRDGIKMDVVNVMVDGSGEKATMELVGEVKEKDGSCAYRNEMFLSFEVKEGKIQSVREYMDLDPFAKYLEMIGSGRAKVWKV